MELEQERRRVERLRAKVNRLQEQFERDDEAVKRVNAELTRLYGADGDIKARKDIENEYAPRIGKLEADLSRLRDSVDKDRDELSDLRDRALRRADDGVFSRMFGGARAADRMNDQVKAFERSIDQRESQINEKEAQLDKLKDAMNNALNSKSDYLAELQRDCEDRLNKLERKCFESEKALSEAQEELRTAESDLAYVEEDKETGLSAEVRQLHKIQSLKEEHQKALEELKKEHRVAEQKLQDEITQLKINLAGKDAEKLEALLEKEKALIQKDADLRIKGHLNESMQEDLTEMNKEYQKLRKDFEEQNPDKTVTVLLESLFEYMNQLNIDPSNQLGELRNFVEHSSKPVNTVEVMGLISACLSDDIRNQMESRRTEEAEEIEEEAEEATTVDALPDGKAQSEAPKSDGSPATPPRAPKPDSSGGQKPSQDGAPKPKATAGDGWTKDQAQNGEPDTGKDIEPDEGNEPVENNS